MSDLTSDLGGYQRSLLMGLSEHLRMRGFQTSEIPFEHSLIPAAMVSTVGFCKRLIDAGADPLIFDERGNTPLAQAAHSGLADICKFLLEIGVPVDHALPGFRTPLFAACEAANYVAAKVLVDAGANVSDQVKGWRAIHLAAMGGSVEIGKLLVSAGASLHDKVHSVSVGEITLVEVAKTCHKNEFVAWLESDVLNASTSPIQTHGRKVRL